MFGYFYNSSFRRYAVLMGDLFSNIKVKRQRSDGTKYIRVPITNASKEHFMMKLNKWTSINSKEDIAKVDTVLPRINVHMVDVMYNAGYKTSLMNKNIAQKGLVSAVSQYNPSPIKMIYEVSVFTRYEDDMFQIVEQIMPYFQPHFNTTMWEQFGNDIPFKRDIRIVLQSISMDEQIDGDSISRRRLEWSLMFEVNGWMYPPVEDIEGEIRTTYIDFHANSRNLGDSSDIYESVDTEVVPRDIDPEDWDGESKQTMSTGIPIPVAPQPPAPRGK